MAPAPAAAPPLPLTHPAALLAALVLAAIVVLSVTYDVFDPDQWQHLTVGRFIWEQHRFPTTQLWTWPTYGQKDVDYAWGFEALAWPFWKWGGLLGLYAWRWLTTLAAFGFAWAAARRMGARGLVPLVVGALCAMIYRGRTQVRPETVAGVLLAAEIFLLEARRHGGRVHGAWLVLVAWIWANTHISYYQFFVLLGIHAAAESLRRRAAPSSPPPRPRPGLWLTGLLSAAVMFVNPSGWRTLWQPFEFFLVWRHEPIYRNINELQHVDWSVNWKNGLPLLLVLWPLLALWRARRRGPDAVELATCAAFTACVLFGQRFMAVYALAAFVYVSRDLDEALRSPTWPAWTAPAWRRAGLAAAGCLLVAAPDLMRREIPIRVHFPANRFPVAACDYIQAHGLRGRLYNPYGLGGYICFRFWPERDRLPFMGIHQEGTQELRFLYMAALVQPEYWRRLDQQCRFDVLLLYRNLRPTDDLPLTLDADSAWAAVFMDDVACVYVRRGGPFARLARDSAYAVIPTDPRNLGALGQRAAADSALRRRAESELWRQVAASPYHARALDLLSNIALSEGRLAEGTRLIRQALAVDPLLAGARDKLGVVALAAGRPAEAQRWFDEERSVLGYAGGRWLRRGQVAQARGDLRAARDDYAREVRAQPDEQEARDSLEAIGRRIGGR